MIWIDAGVYRAEEGGVVTLGRDRFVMGEGDYLTVLVGCIADGDYDILEPVKEVPPWIDRQPRWLRWLLGR